MQQVNIKTVPTGQIKPYWRNPRKNQKTVDALIASITKYGFNVPLVLDRNYVIITGHARYKALLSLGWNDVPCIISEMNEQQAKEYRIADNKTSEISEWDKAQLDAEIREIGEMDFLKDFFAGEDIIGKFSFGGINDFNITPNTVEKNRNIDIDGQQQKQPIHPRDFNDIPKREDNMVYTPAAKIEEESSAPRYYKNDSPVPLSNETLKTPQNNMLVTEQQVYEAKEKQEHVIDRINERKASVMVELICPHCLEQYSIDFNTIENLKKMGSLLVKPE